MSERDKGKTIVCSLTILMFAFYTFIVGYILFAVLHIDSCENFITGLAFQIVGLILLFVIIGGNILRKENIKTGYFVPLLIITIIYSIILDCLNFAGILSMSHTLFFLLHIILLFVYLLIAIPMYIMGNNK